MLLRLPLSVFGIVTFKMPSLKEAFALSESTLLGKDRVRWYSPLVISRRKYLPSSFFSSFVDARIVIVWLLMVTSRSSFFTPGKAAWTSSSLSWSMMSTFGKLFSKLPMAVDGKFQSKMRGHRRERKSSKKLSKSSNEIRLPDDEAGLSAYLVSLSFIKFSSMFQSR